MGPNLQNGKRLRPVDLARAHGLSTQAIRNYEEAGILPAAGRTPYGHRTYTPLHAQALRAFVALVPGHGHQTATSIMRAAGGLQPLEAALRDWHGRLVPLGVGLQADSRASSIGPSRQSSP